MRVVLTLDGPDAVRAARWLLKTALRRFGLRAVDVRQVDTTTPPSGARSE